MKSGKQSFNIFTSSIYCYRPLFLNVYELRLIFVREEFLMGQKQIFLLEKSATRGSKGIQVSKNQHYCIVYSYFHFSCTS